MFNKYTWKSGEKLAVDYLKKIGYKIKYTNFSCVGVELDIVAILSKKVQQKKLKEELKQKLKNQNNKVYAESIKKAYKNLFNEIKDILIIVEVKSRANEKFGTGADSMKRSSPPFSMAAGMPSAAETVSELSTTGGAWIRASSIWNSVTACPTVWPDWWRF